MLMKPRRWLAYTVEVNDLLPCFESIVDRLEGSEIPLDGTFGSNTLPGVDVPGLLIAIGPSVEPQHLLEVLSLLRGLGQAFLVVHEEATHSKYIGVGALNLNNEPVVAVSDELLALIRRPDATAADLCQAMAAAPRIHVLAGRGEQE